MSDHSLSRSFVRSSQDSVWKKLDEREGRKKGRKKEPRKYRPSTFILASIQA